jgi:predicted MFS family arabinose efflux permease
VVMVALMRVAPQEVRANKGSAWNDMREGLSYVRRTPIVLALITTSLVLSVFAVPYVALMPVVQREVLNAGPEALGYLTAAPGVGAVISTLGLASISNKFKRKGILLLSSLVLMGVGLVIYAQMTTLVPALLALVVVGGAQIFCLSVTLTMLQLAVPDALRGRVMSIAMMDRGLTPLGTLVAGLLADLIGAPATVTVMGLLVIGLTLITTLLVPQLRRFAQ